MIAAIFGFVLGALVACSPVPLEPCETETRLVAQVDGYGVVCRRELRPLQLAEVTVCAVWPVPVDSMMWLGNVEVMAERGVELREVTTCKDTPLTESV